MFYFSCEKLRLLREASALNQIGEQVAHDIRSPLAALDMIVYNCQTFSENERVLVRKAVSRITDISNNLLVQYDYRNKQKIINEHTEPEMIADLLSSILAEKRLQYEEKNINWHLEISPETFGVFVNLLSSDFKRVISNLIDNSVDAIKDKDGTRDIVLYLKLIDFSMIEIRLVDSGCGIPGELLFQKYVQVV